MRFVFLLLVAANLFVLAWGAGFLGVAPADAGRNPPEFNQRNQQAVIPGTPR